MTDTADTSATPTLHEVRAVILARIAEHAVGANNAEAMKYVTEAYESIVRADATAAATRTTTPDTSQIALDVLAAFESLLVEVGDNLHYWSLGGGDDTAAEAHRRLIELLAITLQAIASDITDAIAHEPGLTPQRIVDRFRARAALLHPDTERWYDPASQHD